MDSTKIQTEVDHLNGFQEYLRGLIESGQFDLPEEYLAADWTDEILETRREELGSVPSLYHLSREFSEGGQMTQIEPGAVVFSFMSLMKAFQDRCDEIEYLRERMQIALSMAEAWRLRATAQTVS